MAASSKASGRIFNTRQPTRSCVTLVFISDLRSAIVREAAGAIACLAEVLPTPVFDSVVDLLAPEIIKGLPIAGQNPLFLMFECAILSDCRWQCGSLQTAQTLQRGQSSAAPPACALCSTFCRQYTPRGPLSRAASVQSTCRCA